MVMYLKYLIVQVKKENLCGINVFQLLHATILISVIISEHVERAQRRLSLSV